MDESTHELWRLAASRALAEKPELVPDVLHIYRNLWAGQDYPASRANSEFARPLLLDWISSETGEAGLGFAASLPGLYTRGGGAALPLAMVGSVAAGALWLRAYQAEERAKVGMELWRKDPTSVLQAISNLGRLQHAQRLYLKSFPGASPLTFAAENSLKRIDELFAEGDIPDPSDPPEMLRALAGVGTGMPGAVNLHSEVGAGIARAVARAAGRSDALRKYVDEELGALKIDLEETQTALRQMLDKIADESALRNEEAAQVLRIQEVVGLGRLFGLVVGLKHPSAGAAITTVVEQGVILQQAFAAGVTAASLASGVGAVLAIAGAMGALGQQRGDATVDAIASVLKTYIDTLAGHIQQSAALIRSDLARFGEYSAARFDRLQDSIYRIAESESRQETSDHYASVQTAASDIAEAMTRLANLPSAALVLEAVSACYLTASVDAASEAVTGQRSQDRGSLTRELCAVLRESRAVGRYRWAPSSGNFSPMAVAQFLELYPTLLCDGCSDVVTGRFQLSADTLASVGGALAWPPRAVSPHSASLLAGGGLPLPNNAYHLGLASYAFSQMLTAVERALIDRSLRPVADLRSTLNVSDMVRDVRICLEWSRKAVRVLGSETVIRQALEVWYLSAEAVLLDLVRIRRATGVLKDFPEPMVTALFAGAARLQTTGGDRVFDLSLSASLRPEMRGEEATFQTAARVESIEDSEALLDTFRLLGHLGLAQVESVAAWVDTQEGPQPWQGQGSYHEAWALGASIDGGSRVIAWLVVHDGRRGLHPPHLTSVDHPGIFSPISGLEHGGAREYRFQPARGRAAWAISKSLDRNEGTVDGANYCPGPYDGLAGFDIGSVLNSLSGKTCMDQSFRRLSSELGALGISIEFRLGSLDQPGQLAIGELFRALARATKDPIAPTLVRQAHRAWQNALTCLIASADQGEYLDRAIQHLASCPRWLADEEDHTALLGTVASQAVFGGADLLGILGNRDPDADLGSIRATAVIGTGAANPPRACVWLIDSDGASIRLARPSANQPMVGAGAIPTGQAPPPQLQVVTVLPATNDALKRFNSMMVLAGQVDESMGT